MSIHNLTIQLNEEALKQATLQAISGTLSPETKTKIIENAIMALLTPQGNGWSKQKSVIEEIFEYCLREVAREEAQRMVKENENIRERLEKLLRETADKVLKENTEVAADAIASALVSHIKHNI